MIRDAGRRVRILSEDAGAELVEFALMGILFFVLLLGTMEFSRMIWMDNIVASAAKDGARWAAARGATADTPATSDSVSDYVQTRLYGMSGVTVTTTWNPTDKTAGSIVTVSVQGSFQPIVSILPQQAIRLRSTAQMRISR